MKKTLYFILLTLLVSSLTVGYAGATKQVKKSKKVTAQAYDQAKHDANVKSRDAVSAKEESKTGKNRACAIYVNNHRGYYVDVYMDGYYYGTVAPYGAYTFYPGDGWTKIYCETTNGLYWWSDQGSCYSWNSFDLW